MSGEGPESIPTSADPRSKRPVKKRALTPVSAQAANVDALFAKPDQEIRIPAGPVKPRIAAPPEIVTNVQGSSAGAGSGEFHVYKAARRREYERLRQMDEEVQKEKEAEDFEKLKMEREAKDDEKTRRNREKREKMKARKAKAKAKAKGGAVLPPQGASNGAGNDPKGLDVGGSNEAMDEDGDVAVPQAAAEGPGIVIHDED